MFTIAVCDDQKEEREALKILIEEFFTKADINYIVYEYESGEKLVAEYEERDLDLLLLDIFMEGINGFDAAKEIRSMDKYVPIAFLTSSKDFAIESYEVEAVGYLVKPVKRERFFTLLEKQTKSESTRCLVFKKKGHIRQYEYRDILYIESHGHTVTLHLHDGSEDSGYYKLDDLGLDDDRFLRCHKSYLVNMDYIKYAENDFLMADGSSVPIRAHGRKEIVDMYTKYFVKKHIGDSMI